MEFKGASFKDSVFGTWMLIFTGIVIIREMIRQISNVYYCQDDIMNHFGSQEITCPPIESPFLL
jgi:hypothetical protein